jgi:uncharacterized protein (UPF0335 family)
LRPGPSDRAFIIRETLFGLLGRRATIRAHVRSPHYHHNLPVFAASRLTSRLLSQPYRARSNERQDMTDTVVGIAGDRIRSIVERIEHVEEEIKALNEGKKEIFAEAKGEGFDVKVIKEILRLRKQDKDERDEHESLLDLYLSAMESSEAERAKAA